MQLGAKKNTKKEWTTHLFPRKPQKQIACSTIIGNLTEIATA